MAKIKELLVQLSKNKASDLHIKVDNKPFIRVDGMIKQLTKYPVLANGDVDKLANELMSEKNKKRFKEHREVDFAISANGERFRLNIFTEKDHTSIVARHLTMQKRTFKDLNLPPVLEKFADAPRGLVLVTGIAGSGKTTTISAMIDWINNNKPANIITVEDPIEYIYEDRKSIIRQRELGADTETYSKALKHIVRQDPDVIFIGEIRDHETMDSAMKATELGNLVFSTLHTINATETVNRIIDLYPPHQQGMARIILSSALQAIVSLRLLPKKGGGRIPAVEVFYNTSTTKEYILDPKETYLIKKSIREGDYYGMQSFDQSLVQLIKKGHIDVDTAKQTTESQQDLQLALKDENIL
ncbi:MAG: PilT/PilU family type 4a pilus ATPase [Actinobacteria bacterium]|nr:MAG: PilT/PilU family type 4a pilus ATPase [Actinomycetota bacterium]